MTRTNNNWFKKLNYILKFWVDRTQAKRLTKLIFKHKLSISKRDCYRKNGGHALAIHKWSEKFINKINKNRLFMEKNKDDIDSLRKENEKLKEENQVYKDALKILNHILKQRKEKAKKEEVKKAMEQMNIKSKTTLLLKALGFPSSTYYYENKIKEEKEENKHILELVLQIRNKCKYNKNYGWRKLLILVNEVLKSENKSLTTEWKFKQILQKNGIKSELKTKQRRKDPKNTKFKCSDKIQRNWKADEPGVKLYTDVTYFWTYLGFLYISVILDGYDFKPIGWAVSWHNDTKLVLDTFKNLTRPIKPYAIIHSDHGSPYCSKEFVGFCRTNNLIMSMSRVGESLDNYPIEHFWSFAKTECLEKINLAQRNMVSVKKELTYYYNWFNNERIGKELRN